MSSNIPDPVSPLPGNPDPVDIEKNKVFAILAYVGILFLVPLLAAKESPYARYHTNQGIVLFLVGVGTFVVLTVISFVPIIGWLFACIMWPVTIIGWLVMAVLGVINAAQGKQKPLPVIGGTVLMK